MQPLGPRHEELRRRATDAEPEVVVADDALADHPVADPQTPDRRTGRDDLAGPLVPGDYRVAERNDVTAFEQFDVRVADTHRP